MADKKRQLPDRIVDADGRPTLDFQIFMDDLIYGSAADSIGTILSGRNTDSAKITGIINGTQKLTDVLIDGRGFVSDELDAVSANVSAASTAASAGALSATISPTFVVGSSATPGGAATSNNTTVTPAGGTSPYTYAWTKVSGDTLTLSGATSATTNFSGTPGAGGTLSAVYRCTVTDNVAATTTVDVNVTLLDLTI